MTLQEGIQRHQQGDLAGAEECYRQVIDAEPNNPDALNLLGVLAYQVGNHAVAEMLFAKAVGLAPMSPRIRKNSGANFLAQGKLTQALSEFEAVIRMQPDSAEALADRAQVRKAMGDLAGAKADYQQALLKQPDLVQALNNLGRIFLDEQDFDAAEDCFKRAIKEAPSNPEVMNNHGCMLMVRQQFEEAANVFYEAVQQDGNNPRPVVNLADCLRVLDRNEDAEVCYTRALGLDPQNAEVWKKYALLLAHLKREAQAVEAYRKAAQINVKDIDSVLKAGEILFEKRMYADVVGMLEASVANNPESKELRASLAVSLFEAGRREEGMALLKELVGQGDLRYENFNNLGNFHKILGDFPKAKEFFAKAREVDPKAVGPIYNLGVVYEELRDYAAAETMYREAIAIHPEHVNSQWNLALVLLKLGKYAEGWERYEWRWDWPQFSSPKRGFVQPLWNGEDLTGKSILVHAEQGLGDSIQFMRYVPLLKQFNPEKVYFEVQPAIYDLVSRALPEVEVIKNGDPLPWFDRQIPTMSFPRAFKNTAENLPAPVPYLVSEPERDQGWSEKLASLCAAGKRRVGVVWAGNALHAKDKFRSIQFAELLPVFEQADVQFVSLQKGEREADLAQAPGKLVNVMGEVDNFLDTLSIIKQLDLVITVDTSVAHLAGAAGVPVWLMIALDCDYRWMLERPDTPWYPNVRLLRQAEQGDWSSVVATLTNELGQA